jgi:hypothetical protein
VNLLADDPAAAVGDEACAESVRVMILIRACPALRRQQSPAEVITILITSIISSNPSQMNPWKKKVAEKMNHTENQKASYPELK